MPEEGYYTTDWRAKHCVLATIITLGPKRRCGTRPSHPDPPWSKQTYPNQARWRPWNPPPHWCQRVYNGGNEQTTVLLWRQFPARRTRANDVNPTKIDETQEHSPYWLHCWHQKHIAAYTTWWILRTQYGGHLRPCSTMGWHWHQRILWRKRTSYYPTTSKGIFVRQHWDKG